MDGEGLVGVHENGEEEGDGVKKNRNCQEGKGQRENR